MSEERVILTERGECANCARDGSQVEYTRSDLCIPLPTLPDEMEDGQTVYSWGDYRIVIESYESETMSFANYIIYEGDKRQGPIRRSIAALLNLPELEVQGNKIVRKG